MLQWTMFISLLLVLAGVVWLVIIGRKQPKSLLESESDLAPPIHELQIHHSAISKMTFQESLSATAFIDATTEATFQNVGLILNGNLGDAANVVVQGVSLVQGTTQIVVEFSEKGRGLVKLGVALQSKDSAGRYLPKLYNAATGQYIEDAREVSRFAQLTSKIASIGAIVVGAAHIISGADVVKRLKRIEKSLQYLVACHRFGQLAKYEAIYSHAREILSRPLDVLGQHELRSLRRHVLEIRSAWRQELRWKVETIADPAQASWLPTWFRKIPLIRKSDDTKLVEDISQAEMEISAIEYSLRLDLALAAASGSLDSFLGLTLPAELVALKDIEKLIRSKSQLISGKYPDLSADSVTDRLSELHAAYAEIAGGSQTCLASS